MNQSFKLNDGVVLLSTAFELTGISAKLIADHEHFNYDSEVFEDVSVTLTEFEKMLSLATELGFEDIGDVDMLDLVVGYVNIVCFQVYG